MKQKSLLTLFFLGLLPACSGSRDQSVRTLAQQIGRAENQLKNRTVAIMTPEFRGQSDEAEARELAEQLTHELVSSSSLRVAERSRLRDVLKEQELLQQGIADPATAAKVGRLLLVDAVLIGSITGKADKTEVYLRLVDSETALILKTARGELPAAARTGRQANQASAAGILNKPSLTSSKKPAAGMVLPPDNSGNLETSDEAQGRLVDISYRKAGPGGYHQVIGRVENFSKVQLNSPTVSLQLYDASGNLLGGSPCSSPDQPVLAGQKLPFSCLFKPPAGFARFEASLDIRSTLFATKSLALSASGLKFRRDAGSITGDYQLSGIVRNDDETVVTYPRILISIFDSSGKFIGSGYGYSVKKELAPGEASPFAVTIHSFSLQGKAAKFEVFYSALPTRR
ncbi:MAG: CsgG/HfaB family protein [Spirochaetota bacterium]